MVNFPNLTVNADGFAAGYFGSLGICTNIKESQ